MGIKTFHKKNHLFFSTLNLIDFQLFIKQILKDESILIILLLLEKYGVIVQIVSPLHPDSIKSAPHAQSALEFEAICYQTSYRLISLILVYY